MTTTVKILVSGKYEAHVSVSHADGEPEEHIVIGNYEGSPASGELTISLRHPADATIRISEAPIEGL